jgi:hypothetical protein
VAVLILLDLVTAFVVGIALPMVVPGRLQDLPFGIPLLMIGLWSLWMVVTLHLRRPVVSVTPSGLRARGPFGVTHRAQWSEIASIDLSARHYGRSAPLRVPYVRKADGGGFWLDALVGDLQRRPADPAQLEILRRLQAMLNLS